MALFTDLSYLRDLTDNDESLIRESLKRYLTSSPNQLDKLVASTKSRDWDGIHDSAHSLFATTQIVGVSKIAITLKELQKLSTAVEKDYELIKSKVEYVAEVVAESQKEITKHLDELDHM